DVNRIAAQIARKACDEFETPQRARYVIGSIGPTRKLISVGMTSWDVLVDSFLPQMRGLISGGADALLIETQQDMLAIKCAISAANSAMQQLDRRIPIIVQASFDTANGQQTPSGPGASAVVATFCPYSAA